MNCLVQDVGVVCQVSQFTLYGNAAAAVPTVYQRKMAGAGDSVCKICGATGPGIGPAGADRGVWVRLLKVSLVNDGPVTILSVAPTLQVGA